jgi:predicted N-acetyltransferase YhbS
VTDSVRLRDALPADREAVAALTLRAYGEYAQAMEPRAWQGLEGALRTALAGDDPAVQRIVAECEGELVGSVMLFPPAENTYGELGGELSWPELRLLAVAPSARGMGVGRALVDECVRRARAGGAAELGLHTSRSMRVALAMYERMGFLRAPEYDFQPPGAALVATGLAWRAIEFAAGKAQRPPARTVAAGTWRHPELIRSAGVREPSRVRSSRGRGRRTPSGRRVRAAGLRVVVAAKRRIHPL